MDDQMRAEFEAWYAHQAGCDIRKLEECRWGSKGYRDPFAANAWFAWKASRAALEIELPEKISQYNTDDVGFVNPAAAEHDEAIDDCRAAIEAAGVRVKP